MGVKLRPQTLEYREYDFLNFPETQPNLYFTSLFAWWPEHSQALPWVMLNFQGT